MPSPKEGKRVSPPPCPQEAGKPGRDLIRCGPSGRMGARPPPPINVSLNTRASTPSLNRGASGPWLARCHRGSAPQLVPSANEVGGSETWPECPSSLKVNVKPTQRFPAQAFSALSPASSLVAVLTVVDSTTASDRLLLLRLPRAVRTPRAHGLLVILWFLPSVPFVELASQSLVSPSNRRIRLQPRPFSAPRLLFRHRVI